jgi:hypothetical protein
MSEISQEIKEVPPRVTVKRINSKKKGSNFERTISGFLSKHLAPLNFKRTQQSGAITGGKNSRFNSNYSAEALSIFIGDICPINEADVIRETGYGFKFSLECKFYKDCDNLNHLFTNTKIKGWFDQAMNDAAKIKKEPLLIFKFNHTETFCATNYKTLDRLPNNLTCSMLLNLNNGVSINIFLLNEAILDLEWWKLK